jgi:hypothetical protein
VARQHILLAALCSNMCFAYTYRQNISAERWAFALSSFTVHQLRTRQLNQHDTASALTAMALEGISVASSITALLQAGSAIINFISLMQEASDTIRKTLTEIREWDIIFNRLQKLIEKLDNSDEMNDRKEMVYADHFLRTLIECLESYDKLTKILDRVGEIHDDYGKSRLKALTGSASLAYKDTGISRIISYLRDRKLSLSLVLSIFTAYNHL